MSLSQQPWRQPLSYLAAMALLFGVLWRFQGLGKAPFAVDEYYFARSVENLLRSGFPAFACGGYYMRGVVLQYLTAAGQLSGLAPELAPRLISVFSSLISLPAVFILGSRLHGRLIGTLALTIIALSVWEVEMARFGRMYAPFQAVFLWYMVFFLRYTVDRETRALWPMIALSIFGPLIWEGGVFLTLANLLSIFLQRWPGGVMRNDWRYIACCTFLLGLATWFVTADFRGYVVESWPAGYSMELISAPIDPMVALRLPLTALRSHPWWLATALAPLGASLLALPWIWSHRSQPFAIVGLLAMLITAASHQLLATSAIGLLLMMTRLTTTSDLFGRPAVPFHTAIVLFALTWLAYGLFSVDWAAVDGGSRTRGAAILAYQLLRFPDLIGVVIRPWAKVLPHLGAALLLLTAIALIRAAKDQRVPNYERILLVTSLILLLAASASHPPRHETRYVFFLYPIAVIVSLSSLARLVSAIAHRYRRLAAILTSTIALSGFAVSEDFQPHHLLKIDSPAETFRQNMTQDMQSHLIIRDNYRAIALWLVHHANSNKIVINGVHGLDHYYAGISYFFVDQHDPNFPDWSCRRGTIERWGNYPLLSSVSDLRSTIPPNSRAYLVVFGYNIEQTMLSLAVLQPRVAMSEGHIVVLELQG
jgi:hypothetical protein